MVVLIDGSVYFLTTNQAVEGSNPSTVTKNEVSPSNESLRGFFYGLTCKLAWKG
jgi:hypothetical protein